MFGESISAHFKYCALLRAWQALLRAWQAFLPQYTVPVGLAGPHASVKGRQREVSSMLLALTAQGPRLEEEKMPWQQRVW